MEFCLKKGCLQFNKIKPRLKLSSTFFSKIIDPFSSVKSFWLWFAFFSVLYLLMYQGAYMNLLTWAIGDDLLFFERANYILKGNWLGEYNYVTLAKVPGYSIFLAFCIKTGIPYLLAISLTNIIAVGFFLHCSMWLFKNSNLLLLLMGISLLFNPFFASQLRIFRNQFAAICFIVFLGVIISMFNPKIKHENAFMKFVLGFISFWGFGFLFYTREESMLYYGILSLSIIAFFLIRKNISHLRRNLFLPAVGVLGILFMGIFISSMNYRYYGRFITCEKASAPYTTAIRAFHSVADPDLASFLPKNTASYEKIVMISEFVPSFEAVSKHLCDPKSDHFKGASTYLDREEFVFKKLDDEYLSTSHFEWVWASCVAQAGYYKDAKTTAAYYDNLAMGINNAVKLGQLEKRNVFISMGPYFIMKNDLPVILKIFFKNHFKLIGQPKKFIKKYTNLTVRPIGRVNMGDLDVWQNALKVNYLHPDEKVSIKRARNSMSNYFWNLFVKIYAYTMVPIMLLTIPLVLLSIAFAIIRRKWPSLIVVVVVSSGFLIHLFMLSAIDVVVGYEASNVSHFFSSFATIIITCFFAINTFFQVQENPTK